MPHCDGWLPCYILCTLESPGSSASWNVSKLIRIPPNTNFTFPVLQIPLWSDSGLVSLFLWFSCFLCWLCWRRQVPHIKSKSGPLSASHRTRQGVGGGGRTRAELIQGWGGGQGMDCYPPRSGCYLGEITLFPGFMPLVALINSGFLVFPCCLHADPRSDFYVDIRIHFLPFLERVFMEEIGCTCWCVYRVEPGGLSCLLWVLISRLQL